MNTYTKQGLTKAALLCAALFLSREVLAKNLSDFESSNLEGSNIIGPRNFTIAKSKPNWDNKPQEAKTNLVEYCTKTHPEFDQALESLFNSKELYNRRE